MTDAGPAPAADLGAVVAALSYDDLPVSVVRAAERRFADTVGVALAGAAEGAGALATETFATLSTGPATLLGGGSAAVHDAAFVNGVAGHCLDYDDVLAAIHVHPSVVVVPAVLAVAEAQDLDGPDAIAAYVAGVEAQWYAAAPVTPGHYERGWHATGTIGTVGATAAVARLLGLDAGETTHALNAAVSAASGLKRNFGSMTKPFHAGHATAAGVVTAHLAARGFTASADAWTGPNGFYDCFGGADPPDYGALPPLDDSYVLDEPGLDVKKFPCCYFTHAPAEAAATLTDDYEIAPGDVERVVAGRRRHRSVRPPGLGGRGEVLGSVRRRECSRPRAGRPGGVRRGRPRSRADRAGARAGGFRGRLIARVRFTRQYGPDRTCGRAVFRASRA